MKQGTRRRLSLYIALAVLWALLAVQAIAHASQDERLSLAGLALWFAVQTALLALCGVEWRKLKADKRDET